MEINGNVITWTPAEGVSTSGKVTLTVSDGELTDTEAFTVTVTTTNTAPVISSIAPTTATEHETYTYSVLATDPEGATLTYLLSSYPSGMTISGNTIYWTPGEKVTSGNVSVLISDGNMVATQNFTITVTAVNDPPVISSTAPAYVLEGTTYTYTVNATDPEGATLSYNLSNAPTGMVLNGNVITWTPAEGVTSSGEVTLTVSDGELTYTQVFVTTAATNTAPVISSKAPTTATEGVGYTYTVVATDPEGTTLSYNLSNAPTGMVINNNVITWTPAEGITTSGKVTLTVSDGKLSITETFTVLVTNTKITLIVQSPNPGCENGTIDLPYTILSGSPTEYQVIFSNEAIVEGISNVGYTALSSSGTSGYVGFNIPKGMAHGTYSAVLQMRNPVKTSDAYFFKFTVNLSSGYLLTKFDDIILIDNRSGRFTSYQWFKDSTAISGANKQFYNDPQGLSGAYYVKVVTSDSELLQTCPLTANSKKSAVTVSLDVYPNPIKVSQDFTVSVGGLTNEELQGATLSVYNNQGILVYSTNSVKTLNNLKIGHANGFYQIQLTTTIGKELNRKILIIK
jgi:hypothetical protein